MNNFAGIGSVLIAGIYYLVLHRKVSTFSNINFDTQQGKQILLDTVEEMIEYAFVPNNISVSNKQPQTATEIAQNMLEIGVNTRIIELSTGLTAEEINNLSEPRFM
jgi:hypothetical protein